jgi:hypothetical protein
MRTMCNVLKHGAVFGVGVCNIQGGSTYFERSRAYSETTGLCRHRAKLEFDESKPVRKFENIRIFSHLLQIQV